MFERCSIKHSSQNDSINSSLENIVVDIDEQQQELISGGNSSDIFFIILYSSKPNLPIALGAGN